MACIFECFTLVNGRPGLFSFISGFLGDFLQISGVSFDHFYVVVNVCAQFLCAAVVLRARMDVEKFEEYYRSPPGFYLDGAV